MRIVRVPVESRLLLWAAAWLVARRAREDWRKEWQGEIWWWISTQPNAGRTPRERLALLAHCSGAIPDAACLWHSDEHPRADLRGPGACLTFCVAVIACIAVFSGGFGDTRRSLEAAFRPQHDNLAILSQTGPFMGQQRGVPPRKVAYWDARSQSLDGVAIYSWYRSAAGTDRASLADVPAAKVGARFFSLLRTKPYLGRLFAAGDPHSCGSCVVLSHDFWKRLGGDRAVIGRSILVDGRPSRVIGVLPSGFWFLGETPAVWSLYEGGTWTGFPVLATGALCRLRPGVAPLNAEWQLRRLAREVVPRESGTWAAVTPLDEIIRRPVVTLGPLFLALMLVSILPGLLEWGGLRAMAFLAAKASLLLTAVFLAGIEFIAAASLAGAGGLLIAAVLCVRWTWNDQRKRCPQCLSRLMLPVRIGEGSRMLLEPGGTEMACPRGHGILFTAEGESIAPKGRWYPLDVTAGGLLAPAGKTSA
jgi:hypothetical protein